MGVKNNNLIIEKTHETLEPIWKKPIFIKALNFACAIAAILQVGLLLAAIDSPEYKEAKTKFYNSVEVKFIEEAAKDAVSVFGFRAHLRHFKY